MIPRITVIVIARRKRVRSSARICQTAYWQVTELRISRIVAGPTNGRMASLNASPVSVLIGGHCGVFARTLKYAANNPPKNITSEVMNRSIPRTGLLIPPCVSWGIDASGLCSTGSGWVSVVIAMVAAGSVGGRPAVPDVEHRPLGSDLGEVVEVVRGWRRRGRPFERVAFPRVVARWFAAAQRQEDVPEEQQHARCDGEPADGGQEVEVVPARGRGIVGDPPRHARQAELVHREEGQVEADEHDDELGLADRLVHHLAGHLGEPVVEAGHHAED